MGGINYEKCITDLKVLITRLLKTNDLVCVSVCVRACVRNPNVVDSVSVIFNCELCEIVFGKFIHREHTQLYCEVCICALYMCAHVLSLKTTVPTTACFTIVN